MSEAAEQLEELDIPPEGEEAPPETPEATGEETPPETQAEGEEAKKPRVEFSEDQQRIMDERIGAKAIKAREADRRAEEAERRAAEIQAELDKLKAPTRPEVPDFPDRLDFDTDQDYIAAVVKRDEAVTAQAQYDANVASQQAAQQRAIEQEQQQTAQELRQINDAFMERSEKVGFKFEEVDAAAGVVGDYGLHPAVGLHILKSDNGPDLTMYLAKRPMELEKIASMDPIDAGIYIASEVVPKAIEARPGPKVPPAPVETETGAGLPADDGGPDGATYT